MIISRYIFKETIKTQIAVLAVLLLIFTSQKFVRVLASAADGNLPGEIVAQVMLLNMPNFLILILPISLFIGILVSYGRFYVESEMTALFAVGFSNMKLMKISMFIGMISMVLAAFNTLYVSPNSSELEQQLLDNVNAKTGLSTIQPGRFSSLGNGIVAFVEKVGTKDSSLDKVFVAHGGNVNTRPSVIMAESGGIKTRADGSEWLVLNQGRRHERSLEALDHNILEFEVYEALLEDKGVSSSHRRLRALPTKTLIGSDKLNHIAELQWRISLPLSIPILVLLVVPLSAVNPRQGRYAKVLPAILLYLSYYLLMSAARSALEDGKIPPSIGIWSVHVLMLCIALVYIFIGSEQYRLIKRWFMEKRGV